MAINQTETLRMFKQLATIIVEADKNADYEESSCDNMSPAVTAIIEHFNLTRSHTSDFVKLRHDFERAITKRYKVKYKYTLSEAAGQLMRKRNVPQITRIMSGMLDLTIARLNTIQINMNNYLKEAA